MPLDPVYFKFAAERGPVNPETIKEACKCLAAARLSVVKPLLICETVSGQFEVGSKVAKQST